MRDDPEYDRDWSKFLRDYNAKAEEEEPESESISPAERKRRWKREYGRLLRELESQKQRDVVTERVYARRKAEYKKGLQEVRETKS